MWDPLQAPVLACRHAGDELVWESRILVPRLSELLYKYAVVDEKGTVVSVDSQSRCLKLPSKLTAGAVVLVSDEWQVCQCCRPLLSRSCGN